MKQIFFSVLLVFLAVAVGLLRITSRGRGAAQATATLAVVLTASMMVAPRAHAVVLTVFGVDYDIVLLSGSFNEFSDQLTNTAQTPWWGNDDLAQKLAAAYYDETGSKNRFFSFRLDPDDPNENWAWNAQFTGNLSNSVLYKYLSNDGNLVYATTSGPVVPVPEINGTLLGQLAFLLLVVSIGISIVRSRPGVGSSESSASSGLAQIPLQHS